MNPSQFPLSRRVSSFFDVSPAGSSEVRPAQQIPALALPIQFSDPLFDLMKTLEGDL